MHEISVAISIVETVEKEAKKQEPANVSGIVVEIGTLSNIVIESLQFALKSAIKDTCLEKAEIKLITLPAKAKCEFCGTIFGLEDYYSLCPVCQSFQKTVIEGDGLRIKSITLEKD